MDFDTAEMNLGRTPNIQTGEFPHLASEIGSGFPPYPDFSCGIRHGIVFKFTERLLECLAH